MTKETLHLVALDCGNSSVRSILGKYDEGKITIEPVYQVANNMEKVTGYYYWDIIRIFSKLKQGLKAAVKAAKGRIDGIGICTWGVDFALFDKDGFLISNPLSYRNDINAKILSTLTKDEQTELFNKTGILCDKINSVYMMAGMNEYMPGITKAADKLLMIPDIFNYLFTGKMLAEPSEFSTTQLMNSADMELSTQVLEKFNINRDWFPPIAQHGKTIGYLNKDICEEIGIDYEVPVICVPSHDTASAVVAVPAKEKKFAFISSGTWSLIGTELNEPLINEQVLSAGYTNEVGYNNIITLLKNSAGMFIVQRVKQEYEEYRQQSVTWDEIVELAKGYEGQPMLFDVNSPIFFNPTNMSETIWDFYKKSHQTDTELNWGALINGIYRSMACNYHVALEELELITSTEFESVYVVGGGSQNKYLNQLCADITGRVFVAGAKESTSMGNIGVQLKNFNNELTLEDIRRIIADSIDCCVFKPHDKQNDDLVDRYKSLL